MSVYKFASDEELWLEWFVDAWEVVTENGADVSELIIEQTETFAPDEEKWLIE